MDKVGYVSSVEGSLLFHRFILGQMPIFNGFPRFFSYLRSTKMFHDFKKGTPVLKKNEV